jgi:hypothetical protein
MRDTVEQLLPDTCYILSVTESPNGMGGKTQTLGTAGTSICRLDMVNTGTPETMQGAGMRGRQETILSLPYDATVTTVNKILHEGITYNVQSVNIGASWMAEKRCTLEKE